MAENTGINLPSTIQTPLGFFTSFFGMNNSLTGADWMTLGHQCLYMSKSLVQSYPLYRTNLELPAQQSYSPQ